MSNNGEEKVDAAIEVVRALSDCIQDLGRVPSGELYARVMAYLNINAYNAAIDSLKIAKLVEEKNHELIWIGPPKV